jgi:hypothetical protein
MEYYIYQAAGATSTLRLLGVPCHLYDLTSKKLQGFSCNSRFGIGKIEVYDGKSHVINGPLAIHILGPKEWVEICKNDSKSYSNSFILLFKIG